MEKGCGFIADNLIWSEGVWSHADNLIAMESRGVTSMEGSGHADNLTWSQGVWSHAAMESRGVTSMEGSGHADNLTWSQGVWSHANDFM